MYLFNTSVQHFVDFEVANWYTSTHPDFIFTNMLSVARADFNCRYTLNNGNFKKYVIEGPSESTELKSVTEMKQILIDVFKIVLPDISHLDERLGDFIKKII